MYVCICYKTSSSKGQDLKIISLSLFFLDSLSLTLTRIYILCEPEPPLRNHPRPRPRPLFYLFAPFPSLPFNFLYLSPYFSIQKYPTFIYWHFLQKPAFTTTQPTNKTMDQDYYKRSGQIPAFGDWDYANELPITQYFECARQAGLIRFSSSSGESADAYVRPADLYAVNHLNKPKPSRKQQAATTRIGTREKRGPRAHVMEQKKQQAKVCDVTQPPTKHYEYQVQQSNRTRSNDAVPRVPPRFPTRPPKPVDEDLYKIPPELLHKTKRKKMLGLLCCLVPACAS